MSISTPTTGHKRVWGGGGGGGGGGGNKGRVGGEGGGGELGGETKWMEGRIRGWRGRA